MYLRSIGRPELEARLGLVVFVVNAPLTVILAIAAGPYGIVAGTLAAYAAGASYFFHAFKSKIEPTPAICYRDLGKSAAIASPFGALAAIISLAVVEWLPSGWAVVPVGAVVMTACLAYVVTRVGLRPRIRLSASKGLQ
jgi:peptidoglycan biosynthesis protein MviN/MurJ (putative lipid II flippase)